MAHKWIQLTTMDGRPVRIAVEGISSYRQTDWYNGEEVKPVTIIGLSNGGTFEVEEPYEEVSRLIQRAEGLQ